MGEGVHAGGEAKSCVEWVLPISRLKNKNKE